MYYDLLARPAYLNALAEWECIAKEASVSRAELTYRWVGCNSPLSSEDGDAIIIGVGSREQRLTAISKGPLDEKTTRRIDGMWQQIRYEAPLGKIDSFRTYIDETHSAEHSLLSTVNSKAD